MILSFNFSYSQTEQYKFRHIKHNDGLSSNYIRCIIKDSRGYMWFGTSSGLNRYDGYNIKTYKHFSGDSTSISNNSLRTIIELDSGLLIGTYKGLNVFHFETERFINYQHNINNLLSISHDVVNVISKDISGLFWVGTDNGLNLFDPSTGTFKVFKQDVGLPQSKKNQINEIYKDHSGVLWVGTNDGLFQFDPTSQDFKAIELIPSMISVRNGEKKINTIIEDHNNVLWIGTDFSVFKIINGTQEWLVENSDRSKYPSNYLINDIVKFSNNRINELWVATFWGINRYDYKSERFTHIYHDPDNKESLLTNGILSLYSDYNGLLWIGSEDGVDILNLNKNPFHQCIQSNEGHRKSSVVFFEDDESNFWIGSPNGGMMKYDKDLNLLNQFTLTLPNGNTPPNYSVFEILEDSKKFMWIGMNRPFPGIYLFDKVKESFAKVAIDTSKNHPEPTEMKAFIEDDEGIVWFGTNSGLYYFDHNNYNSLLIRLSSNKSLSQTGISDLYLDRKGSLWVSSLEGLFCLPEENRKSMDFIMFDSYKNNDNLSGIPLSIIQTKNGLFFLGTTKGLFKLNPESNEFHEIEKGNELIDQNKIYAILEDKNGYLWLNSWKGLIRYNPNAVKGESPKLFDSSDGLPFEDNMGSRPYLSNDGKILIPGKGGKQNGFYYFYPDSIKYNKNIPPLVITDISVKNENLYLPGTTNAQNRIELKYNQNFFSIEFAALDYLDPGKNQYAYYLKGLEDEWIHCGNRRIVNYTNVSPGDYVFKVKGSNNDGYWNSEGASLNITILPPPWKTWWAYTIYVIFLIGVIYAWRRYDLKRLRLKQELEVEQVEAEKLKELDSMKSRFFANISHEFRTPLTLILGALEKLRSKIADQDSDQDLNMMQRNARRLQNLINQLLSLSKLESGRMKLQTREENIVTLVNGYVQSFESLAKQKKIDLDFKSTEDNIPIFVDRDKIEQILYNLLSNAFKFTGEGGRIQIAVSSRQYAKDNNSIANCQLPIAGSDQYAEIKISDTGQGISPEHINHIFNRFYQVDDTYSRDQEGTGIGLALTKELVEIHHGQLTVESEVETGTTFNVYLQIGKEHLKPEEIKNETEITQGIEKPFNPIQDLVFSESDRMATEIQMQDIMEGKEDNPYLLIVDDNADLRTYIKGCLNPKYYLSEARDGEEGYRMATEKIPDLIISDVMMPKMDGNEFCRKLKKDDRTSHIPVILLTAKASMEDKLEGLETGADDFLIKPFDPDELLVRINNLIQQRKKLREQFIKDLDITGQISTKGTESIDRIFLQKAKKTVEENMADFDFSIEDFAEKMNLSRVQLHRKLKALINQSASDFLRTMRLNRSSQLIISKSGNITQIAFEVGFNNLSYFSKCFREQFGVLPSDYTNQNHKS